MQLASRRRLVDEGVRMTNAMILAGSTLKILRHDREQEGGFPCFQDSSRACWQHWPPALEVQGQKRGRPNTKSVRYTQPGLIVNERSIDVACWEGRWRMGKKAIRDGTTFLTNKNIENHKKGSSGRKKSNGKKSTSGGRLRRCPNPQGGMARPPRMANHVGFWRN